MTYYEYKVIPAPEQGDKHRNVKRPEDRFALTLAALMNEMGAEGWEYLRADSLPCTESRGLFGRSATTMHSLLVFRRAVSEEAYSKTLRARHQAPLPNGKAEVWGGAAKAAQAPDPAQAAPGWKPLRAER